MTAVARQLHPLAQRFTSLVDRVASPLGFEDFLALVDPLWSRRQTKARVVSIVPETSDAATVTLRPGRSMDRSTWPHHLPGQHVIVGVDIDGVRHKRAYSLSSAAGIDGNVTITVSALSGGKVSSHIVRDLRPGSIVQLSIPQGLSILPEEPSPLLFITAGSGITPVRAALLALANTSGLDDVVLAHSSRTEADWIFRDEIRRLSADNPGLRLVERFTRSAPDGQGPGRFTSADLDEACPDWRTRRAFVCGPGDMVDHFIDKWEQEKISDQLGFERFQLSPASVKGVGGEVSFASTGHRSLADGSTPILEVGEALGIQMPFGCRMGICHGCIVPLKSGCVRDLRNGKVHGEPGDMIQTCVSAAAGDVEIDL